MSQEVPEGTKIYQSGKAYSEIQADVSANFHTFLGRERNSIRTIVIVGAYHGVEIWGLLESYPNAHVYAFEAHPGHFRQLRINFGTHPNVSIYHACIGDNARPVTFHELSSAGSGSIFEWQADKFGHSFSTVEKLPMNLRPLSDFNEIFDRGNIDLLWVDVQGAELNVLKGVDLTKVESMFLEIKTRDCVNACDLEPYLGACYLSDLVAYAKPTHRLVSVGLDNESNNGSGNSFWQRISGV